MKTIISELCALVMIFFSAYLFWTDGTESYLSVYLPVLFFFGLIGALTAPFLLRPLNESGVMEKPMLEWCYTVGLVVIALPIMLIPLTLGFSLLALPVALPVGSLLFVPAVALLALRKMKK